MTDIVERLHFDAVRCELQFSKGVAGNIKEAATEIKQLRAALADMLAWADTPTQEASPSWIVGACERARRALEIKP